MVSKITVEVITNPTSKTDTSERRSSKRKKSIESENTTNPKKKKSKKSAGSIVDYHPTRLFNINFEHLHYDSLKEWFKVLYPEEKLIKGKHELIHSLNAKVQEFKANKSEPNFDKVPTTTMVKGLTRSQKMDWQIIFQANSFNPRSIIDALKGYGFFTEARLRNANENDASNVSSLKYVYN